MKSKEEFDTYYDKELKQIILTLEERRLRLTERFSYKRYKGSLKWLAIACAIIITLVNGLAKEVPYQIIFAVPAAAVYAAFAPLYIFIRRTTGFKPINKEYKQKVITKIITWLDPQLSYKAEGGISEKAFNDSDLFSSPSSFKSEDLVHGRVGEIPVEISDIQAWSSDTNQNSNSDQSSNSREFFRGLYAIARLNKNFPTRIIIEPANPISDAIGSLARGLLGNEMVDSIKKKMDMETVKTGNDEFDKIFEVKCSD